MYISDSTTCACGAALHVHVKQWAITTNNLSLRGKQTIPVRKADLVKTYLHTPHLFRVLKKVFFCKKETDSLYIIR